MATVLVIEDNPVNMKLAALLLRNAGHIVLCAVDAESGLTLARTEQPDLVLMDLQLPGMDGLTATTLLKQDPATAAIPVIALTAMDWKTGQDDGRLAGFDAFLAKPLRSRELYAAIDTLRIRMNMQEISESDSGRKVDPDASPTGPLPGTVAGVNSPGAGIPQPADAGPVNVGILEGLIGNDPAMILEFLNAFRTSASDIALKLKIACADCQHEQASRQAHMLRSSAHSVGALGLARLCAEMEAAGKAGRTEALKALWPAFEQELDAVNAFLDSPRAPRAVRCGHSLT